MLFKRKKTGILEKVLLTLQDEKEVKDFLRALLTPQEKKRLEERMLIVEGLLQGKAQRSIAEETGASLGTISRGSREVQFGSGIFQKIFERLV